MDFKPINEMNYNKKKNVTNRLYVLHNVRFSIRHKVSRL